MQKEQIIENLLEFAPNVLGVCPECGESVIFEGGWKCFNCGFNPKDMTGAQKMEALRLWGESMNDGTGGVRYEDPEER